MTDTMMAARLQVVEGSALVADSCSWLAQQHRDDGTLTADACKWMALAGLSATVALIAERGSHPTIAQTIAHGCDGAEASTLMLRAVGALWAGDPVRADELAQLAASFEGRL